MLRKEKEKKKPQPIQSTLSPNTIMICNGDTCSISPQISSFSEPYFWKPTETTSTTFYGFANDTDLYNIDLLRQILPSDLQHALIEAMKKNFLASFLLTLSKENLTPTLKAYGYSDKTIYWINQLIQSLTLVLMSTSKELALSSIVINHFLTEYLHMNSLPANAITSGLVMAAGVLQGSLGLAEIPLILAIGIGANIAGNKIAQYGNNLLKNGFFSIKNALIHNEEPTLKPSQQTSASETIKTETAYGHTSTLM